ncbi:MAG TPA: BTAD domain-containing putative transcriptional regulator [Longimicrobium sp.]|nr:BTAD domain-containing putative transcriptional regulator [Longimicrobium sp.]
MSRFSIHVLGDPVLQGPHGPLAGRAAHKRRLAVLAILAVARGRPVGRERLLGLLWGEQTAESARHSLSEAIYVLRKELGEDALLPAGSDVALNPEVVGSDVARFEAALEAGDAEGAVRAYGGPFLDGFYVSDAPEFERWVDGERDRLARAYAGALEALATAAEAEGSALRAVEWWRRLVSHDPFSSRAALRLVRALDAAGERPAALRFADTHAALLREELGVDPDPELAAFVERLRTEPVRTPPPPPPAAAAAADEPGPVASRQVEDGDGRGDAAADAPPPAPGTPAAPVEAVAAPSIRHARRRRTAVLLGGVAGTALGVGLALLTAGTPSPPPPEPGFDPRRIAVLYFDDHTPDHELGYLAGGLTEMLIHELSQVGALHVISRNGVKPYRDGSVPLDSLAARLRVGTVVEGSVQRSRDTVWVTVQLIDAATQSHLESRMVGGRLDDVVALERALAEEVAGFLRRRLGEEVRLRQARAETRSAAAYALVLRALQLRDDAARLGERRETLDRGSAVRLLERADSLLVRAAAADPRWTRPLVERGWVAGELARLADDPRRRAALFARAAELAERALQRQPGSAAALELRGRTRWVTAAAPGDTAGQAARLDGAERDLRAAVEAEPSRASAWSTLSVLLRFRGRFAESDQAARRALAEDAWLADADEILFRLYHSASLLADYRAAAGVCEQGRRQFPADWRFRECALALLRDDPARPADPALAWRLLAELERLDPPARAQAEGRAYSPLFRRALVAAVLARAGARDSARAVLARARAEAASDREVRLSLAYDEAYVRLLLGERQAARRLLDSLVAARPELAGFIGRDPLFRELVTNRPAASGTPPP